MIDVYEVVRQYYELKGYLTMAGIRYSRIVTNDLLVANLATGDYRMVGFTFLSADQINRFPFEFIQEQLLGFSSAEAYHKAAEVLACPTRKIRRIVVIGSLNIEEDKKKAFMDLAKSRGVDEVVEFPAILEELTKLVKPDEAYNSDVLETISILKKHGLLIDRCSQT